MIFIKFSDSLVFQKKNYGRELKFLNIKILKFQEALSEAFSRALQSFESFHLFLFQFNELQL